MTKILDIKATIKPSSYKTPVNDFTTDLLTCFHPVSSVVLVDIVANTKSSSCESYVISPRPFEGSCLQP